MLCSLKLPWPPSVNHYWRHVGPKVLISAEGRRYRQQVQTVVASRKRSPFGPSTARLQVSIDVYPPDRRRRDLDNLLKGLLDAMQHAGLYEDDSQIDDLCISRHEPAPGGEVHVQIWEAEEA